MITLKDAFLFTDGRYFLQAEKQLDKCVDGIDLRLTNTELAIAIGR